jgi:hypothetical protein
MNQWRTGWSSPLLRRSMLRSMADCGRTRAVAEGTADAVVNIDGAAAFVYPVEF